jgi:hypothetical protein
VKEPSAIQQREARLTEYEQASLNSMRHHLRESRNAARGARARGKAQKSFNMKREFERIAALHDAAARVWADAIAVLLGDEE